MLDPQIPDRPPLAVSVRRSGARVTVEAGGATWIFSDVGEALEFGRSVAGLLGGRVIVELDAKPHGRPLPPGKRRFRGRHSLASRLARSAGPKRAAACWRPAK